MEISHNFHVSNLLSGLGARRYWMEQTPRQRSARGPQVDHWWDFQAYRLESPWNA